MPTIHITTDDLDLASAIVTFLIDQGDFTISVEASGGPTAMTAARAATEPHPLVTEVIQADLAATKAAKAARQRATKEAKAEIKRRERSLIADVIGSVGCPTCHSHLGIECATPGGAGYGRTFVHNSRRLAMNARHPAVANIAIPADEM